MSAVYRWKPLASVQIDAQIAGEELERIKTSQNGRLDPASVVNAARAAESPLNKHFEWDDAIAAELHRETQASYLIRSIEVVHQDGADGPSHIRAFVNIKQEGEQFYIAVADALADPETRRQVVSAAWKELESWRQRHAELIEFAKVFSAIDEVR